MRPAEPPCRSRGAICGMIGDHLYAVCLDEGRRAKTAGGYDAIVLTRMTKSTGGGWITCGGGPIFSKLRSPWRDGGCGPLIQACSGTPVTDCEWPRNNQASRGRKRSPLVSAKPRPPACALIGGRIHSSHSLPERLPAGRDVPSAVRSKTGQILSAPKMQAHHPAKDDVASSGVTIPGPNRPIRPRDAPGPAPPAARCRRRHGPGSQARDRQVQAGPDLRGDAGSGICDSADRNGR